MRRCSVHFDETVFWPPSSDEKSNSGKDSLQLRMTEDKLQTTEDQLQRLQVELSAVKSQEARQQDEMNRLYATLIDVLLYFNFLLL